MVQKSGVLYFISTDRHAWKNATIIPYTGWNSEKDPSKHSEASSLLRSRNCVLHFGRPNSTHFYQCYSLFSIEIRLSLFWSCCSLTMSDIYRLQRSWGKVMFLHASVVLLTGGCLLPGGCLLGGGWWRPPGTASAAGGTHPTGMHSCFNIDLK